ncbi:MAG TPA: type II toxin-antitoxin system HigB family toxin [Bacteroidia bacterium]|jgi:mRNA interferase HigB|nr:type II toxin-antitoxin system HigB family toxin [Bacteroidia bacterium]
MNIFNWSTLNRFSKQYPDIKKELELWYNDVSASRWRKPGDVTKDYNDASAVGNGRVVFNIRGNRYRLIVEFNYIKSWAFVVFIGTHAEYDRINAALVNQFKPKKKESKK